MLHPAVRSLRILVLIELGIAVCAYFLYVYLSKEDAFVGTCLLFPFTLYEQDRKTVVSYYLFSQNLFLKARITARHRFSYARSTRTSHARLFPRSLKIFLLFRLAKIPRIIHRNQLLSTKFERILRYVKNDVSFAPSYQIIEQLLEKTRRRD